MADAIERLAFRFDAIDHEYLALHSGEVLPHITEMLAKTGWVDDLWMTEESKERGSAVHKLTADYDLGALDPKTCVSRHRNYLLGHVAAMKIIPHRWEHIEEPLVSARYMFGGRPDRVGILYKALGVLEVKSAAPAKATQVQTALQAILAAEEKGIPPELLLRFAEYLDRKGKFKLEEHRDKRDFDEAYRVIARCCGGVAV